MTVGAIPDAGLSLFVVKGAALVTFTSGVCTPALLFGDGTVAFHRLYNNDPTSVAIINATYLDGSQVTLNVAPMTAPPDGQIISIASSGSTIPTGGVLVFR